MENKTKEQVQSKEKDRLKSTKIQLLLAGAVTFAIFVFYYLTIKRIWPVGNQTILTVDSGQQYVKFFNWMRSSLLTHSSLTYDFAKGYGGEMLSTIAYYLISPFNVILIFFTPLWMPFGVFLVTGLKITAGAVALTYYLRKSNNILFKANKQSIFTFAFGIAYALCSWVASNQLNLIWLDILWLFPLLLLYTEKLTEKDAVHVSVMLAALIGTSIVINYYMAYMALLFIAIYLPLFIWINSRKFEAFLSYVLNGILGVMLSAVIALPTLYQLLTGKMTSGSENSSLSAVFSSIVPTDQIINQFARLNFGFGGIKDMPSGMMQIYCGMGIALLAFIFLFSKKENFAKIKARYAYVFLYFFLLLSTVYKPLILLWHAGQMPVWYGYRFAWVWALITIQLAYSTFINLDKVQLYSIIILAVIITGLSTVGFAEPMKDLTVTDICVSYSLLAVNVAILVFYWSSIKKAEVDSRLWLRWLFVIILLIDSGCNFAVISNKTSTLHEADAYNPQHYMQGIRQQLPHNSGDFYRMQRTFVSTFNDNLTDRIPDGFSFNSNTDSLTRSWRDASGQRGDNNILGNLNQNIALDSLLGFKYAVQFNQALITPQEKSLLALNNTSSLPTLSNSDYYAELADVHGNPDFVSVYKNVHALPLGYVTSPKINSVKLTKNWALNTYNILNAMSGTKKKPYVYRTPINIQTKGLKQAVLKDGQIVYQKTGTTTGEVSVKFKIPTNDTYYLLIPRIDATGNLIIPKTDNTVRQNSPLNIFKNSMGQPLSLEIASGMKGKTVELILNQNAKQANWNSLSIYHFNDKLIQKTLKKLNENPLKLDYIGNNKIIGTVDSKRNGNLFISIPTIKGWIAYVDGKKVSINKAAQTWISLPITKGQHNVSLVYHEPYLKVGMVITLIGLALTIVLDRKFKKKEITNEI